MPHTILQRRHPQGGQIDEVLGETVVPPRHSDPVMRPRRHETERLDGGEDVPLRELRIVRAPPPHKERPRTEPNHGIAETRALTFQKPSCPYPNWGKNPVTRSMTSSFPKKTSARSSKSDCVTVSPVMFVRKG